MSDPARIGAVSGGGPLPPGTLVGNRFRVKTHLRTEAETELYRATDAQSGEDIGLRTLRPSGPVRAVLDRELAKAQRLGPHKNLARVVAVVREADQLLVAQEWPDGHTLREVMDAQKRAGDHGRPGPGPHPAGPRRGRPGARLCPAGARGPAPREHLADLVRARADRRSGAASGADRAGPGRRPGRGSAGRLPGARGGPGRRGDASVGRVRAGRGPVRAADRHLPRSRRCRRPAAPYPAIPPAVDAVVGRALLPNPAGRYPTPSDMMRALEAAVGSPAAAASAEPVEPGQSDHVARGCGGTRGPPPAGPSTFRRQPGSARKRRAGWCRRTGSTSVRSRCSR